MAVAKTPAKKNGGKLARWTAADVKVLTEAMAKRGGKSQSAVFAALESKLGRTASTIGQKWFNMQKSSGGSTRSRKRASTTGGADGLKALLRERKALDDQIKRLVDKIDDQEAKALAAEKARHDKAMQDIAVEFTQARKDANALLKK